MSRKVAKRALLGFAAGALQGAQQFLQTRAAQEAERLREERLAAIRAEERRQDRVERQAERSEDRDFTIKRDEAQRSFQIELMGKQEEKQIARDQRQGEQAMRQIAAQGANSRAYAEAMQRGDRDTSNMKLLVVDPKTNSYKTVDFDKIPDGHVPIAGKTSSGQIVNLTSTASQRPQSNAGMAPGGSSRPANQVAPLPRSGLRLLHESDLPEDANIYPGFVSPWQRNTDR